MHRLRLSALRLPRERPWGHLFPLGRVSFNPTPRGGKNGAGFLNQSFLDR